MLALMTHEFSPFISLTQLQLWSALKILQVLLRQAQSHFLNKYCHRSEIKLPKQASRSYIHLIARAKKSFL